MKPVKSSYLAIALFVGTLLLYAPARTHEYVSYDDHAFVNPAMVQRGLSAESIRWAMTAIQAANWSPVTSLSHITDVTLFGTGPAGPHVMNVLIHCANAVLLFLALLSLTGRRWPSWIVAALFAVHPMHVESVAWIAERKDLLSSFFFFLTLLAYARFVRIGGGAAYALALLVYALGLMSKPMIVTLPCVLLLLDLWPLKRDVRWGRLIAEKVPFLLMSIAISVITYRVQRTSGAMSIDVFPLGLRIENAVYAYGRYLWKTIWPTNLAVFYPYFGLLPRTQIPIAGVLASLAVLILLTVLSLLLWKSNRAALVGWFWFLGMLVPVIGLVQVGSQSMADRYSYLPHVGLFIAVIWAGDAIVRRWHCPARAVGAATACVIVALAFRTSGQLATWKSTETLFTHALAVTSHNHVAHNNLAMLYMQDGSRHGDVREHLDAAIAINPAKAEPYHNRGLLLMDEGRPGEAKVWFERAIELDPQYAVAYASLGSALLAEKNLDRAIEQYRKAIALRPDLFVAHYNLGLAISQRDGDAAALSEFERAVALSPDHAEATYSYALALRAAGREAESAIQFAAAARLAQEQRMNALYEEILRQQNAPRALPKPATKPENH